MHFGGDGRFVGAEVIEDLSIIVEHSYWRDAAYFQPHVTPVQVFNQATDPFLPVARPRTFAVFEDLDARGLRNHVLVITRHAMKPGDIEPYPSSVAAESLNLMSAPGAGSTAPSSTGGHWCRASMTSTSTWTPRTPWPSTPTPRCSPACSTATRSRTTTRPRGCPNHTRTLRAGRSCPRRWSGASWQPSMPRHRCSARPRARSHTTCRHPTDFGRSPAPCPRLVV